jgi:predicted small secreted protein
LGACLVQRGTSNPHTGAVNQAGFDFRRQPEKGMIMLKKLVMMLFALGLSSVALTGCNTIQGAGTDIKHAGSAVQEEAQEHKHY